MVLLVLFSFSMYLGYVFKAIDCASNEPVAIKRSQKVGSRVSREYEILDALRGK